MSHPVEIVFRGLMSKNILIGATSCRKRKRANSLAGYKS